MPRLLPALLATLLALFATAGCHQPKHDDPIRATDDDSFQQWIDAHQDVLTPAEVKELTDARQMIRFRVMQAHPGLPPEEFRGAVYAEINGKTLRDVLITSYSLQIDRVRVELENYKPLVERLRKLRQDPGLSDDGKRDTDAKLAHLDQMVKEHNAELEQFTRRVDELKQTMPKGT